MQVQHATSGPFVALALCGPDAIKQWRSLIGPTHVYKAQWQKPETLRAKYGLSDTRNGFHGEFRWSLQFSQESRLGILRSYFRRLLAHGPSLTSHILLYRLISQVRTLPSRRRKSWDKYSKDGIKIGGSNNGGKSRSTTVISAYLYLLSLTRTREVADSRTRSSQVSTRRDQTARIRF